MKKFTQVRVRTLRKLAGLQLAFANGLGTAGRGKKLCVWLMTKRLQRSLYVLMLLIYKLKHFFMHELK